MSVLFCLASAVAAVLTLASFSRAVLMSPAPAPSAAGEPVAAEESSSRARTARATYVVAMMGRLRKAKFFSQQSIVGSK